MNRGRSLTLEQEQARIDAARDYYLSRGKQVQVLESFEFKPRPARSDKKDPETVLKRRSGYITKVQRQMLKQMTEAL